MTPTASRIRHRRWALTPVLIVGLAALAACSSPAVQPTTSSNDPTPSSQTTAPADATGSGGEGTPIIVTIDGQVLEAHLWDNAPGRDLASRLPLTLEFSDLSNQEKIGHLDESLSMEDMPEGDDPVPTDIGWYEPWGNVVFYYDDVGYWDGIARIGQFDSPVDLIEAQSDDFTATIELAQ